MSHPAFTSVVVVASSDLGDDRAEAFGVLTVAAIVGGILGTGSRLTICDRCGHFPFHDDPYRFVEVVERFINSTQAAAYDEELLRRLLRTGLRRIGRIES
jgi:hypothetical protein